MNKKAMVFLPLFAFCAFLFLGSAGADDGTGGVAADENYTVKKGDTLWDISGSHLNDPFRWEDIWKRNPGIKDPDLIYPGEKLVLPEEAGKEEAAETPSAPGGGGEGVSGPAATEQEERGPFVDKGRTIRKKSLQEEGGVISLDVAAEKKLPVASEAEIIEAGFIADDFTPAAKFSGDALDGRDVYSTGDTVYLAPRPGIKRGDRFLVGKPDEDVDDPSTGRGLGRIFMVDGSLKVVDKKDGKIIAVVEHAFKGILKTDRLLPLKKPDLVFEPVKENDRMKDKLGYIVATKGNRDMTAAGDIVYLDLGSDEGARIGDKFTVRRSSGIDISRVGSSYVKPSRYKLPDIEVGTVQIIAVRPETSTAKLIESKEPIKVGHRAVYKY